MEMNFHTGPVIEKTPAPRLPVPLSKPEKVLETLSALALIAGFFLIFLNWNLLPERVAIHFDWYGKPDGWLSRSTLFVLHIPTVMVYCFLALISLGIKPLSKDKPAVVRQYRIMRFFLSVIKLEILFFILTIEWIIIRSAVAGTAPNMEYFNPIVFISFVAVTLAVFLFYFNRVKNQ